MMSSSWHPDQNSNRAAEQAANDSNSNWSVNAYGHVRQPNLNRFEDFPPGQWAAEYNTCYGHREHQTSHHAQLPPRHQASPPANEYSRVYRENELVPVVVCPSLMGLGERDRNDNLIYHPVTAYNQRLIPSDLQQHPTYLPVNMLQIPKPVSPWNPGMGNYPYYRAVEEVAKDNNSNWSFNEYGHMRPPNINRFGGFPPGQLAAEYNTRYGHQERQTSPHAQLPPRHQASLLANEYSMVYRENPLVCVVTQPSLMAPGERDRNENLTSEMYHPMTAYNQYPIPINLQQCPTYLPVSMLQIPKPVSPWNPGMCSCPSCMLAATHCRSVCENSNIAAGVGVNPAVTEQHKQQTAEVGVNLAVTEQHKQQTAEVGVNLAVTEQHKQQTAEVGVNLAVTEQHKQQTAEVSVNLAVTEQHKQQSSKKTCAFCRKNGESVNVYTGHKLKNPVSKKVICPILRAYVCPGCGATGDNAHTRSYCPKGREHGGRVISTTHAVASTAYMSNEQRKPSMK